MHALTLINDVTNRFKNTISKYIVEQAYSYLIPVSTGTNSVKIRQET